MKRQLKSQIDHLLSGGDERTTTAIYIRKPDGTRILYGCWPPHPTLKPGDPVPETLEEGPQRLNVTADSEATANVFLKLRGERQ